jgi:chloramphenicol-sensitive protein RarD
MHPDTVDVRVGTPQAALAGVSANIFLGLSSIYWKSLGHVPSNTLLGYRIVISLLMLAIVLALRRSYGRLISRISTQLVLLHASAAALVVINWETFIWASIHGHVVESGLGYLVAPFMAIGFGAIWLKERLSVVRLTGLIAIASALVVLLLGSNELAHWVYLTIGVAWGGYACLKKLTNLDPFSGLFLETLALTALMPFFVWLGPFTLTLPSELSTASLVLLALCGTVSMVPLALFSFAAANLPLSVMGFFQFVLPFTQLLVALVVYQQAVSNNTLLIFSVIWTCLIAIVVEPFWKARRQKPTT